MIARPAPAFRSWIERAKGAAILGIAAAAAISGYAFAIAPTVDTGRGFEGAVTLLSNDQPAFTVLPFYTVPAGRQYTLTDILISNTDSSTSLFQVTVGNANCSSRTARTHYITVPPLGSLHVPFQTGIGVGAGKTICIDISEAVRWTIRGYLSNET